MNHECYRFKSNETITRVSFLCSCGCCGGVNDRYCCDPSYCDPTGKGVYLSVPTVAVLICLALCVLVGALVALILALRMRKRTRITEQSGPKEKEAMGNSDDKDQQQVDDGCRQEHIAYIYGLHLQQHQQQHQQQQQHSSWREISTC